MWLRSFLLLVLISLSSVTMAESLPWGDQRYSHFSDQEPLADMLRTLASNQETPIVVSDAVKDVVSMHYRDQLPKDIFSDLVKTHGLIWYFDSETLYVYKDDESQRGSVSLDAVTPQEFRAALERLKIFDDQFQWQVSEVDNVIYFSGPERFVSDVLDMAKIIDNSPKTTRIYKWVDDTGRTNFTNKRPESTSVSDKDATQKGRFPNSDLYEVIDNP